MPGPKLERREDLTAQNLILTMLCGLGRSLAMILDRERLLDYVVEAAVHLVEADKVCLLLATEEGQKLSLQAMRVLGKNAATETRLRIEDSLATMVMQTGQPLLISDMDDQNAEGSSADTIKPAGHIHSLLNVPLKVSGRTIGVLSVVNKRSSRPFTDEDRLLLTLLADHAAIALENCRLYRDAQRTTATEVFRQTVVTLAHHINNPLATLMAGVHALATYIYSGQTDSQRASALQALQTIEQKAEEIASVVSALQEIVVPASTQYWREEKMIDIGKQIGQRLGRSSKAPE